MLKHLIILLSFIQLMHCVSLRSNIWWSRRHEDSQADCKVDYDNENPSLEGKICGYCFAKCQQQFAACLLAQMNHVVTGSVGYCENLSNECEATCLNDKRTGQIAEESWSKVFKILQQFKSYPSADNEN